MINTEQSASRKFVTIHVVFQTSIENRFVFELNEGPVGDTGVTPCGPVVHLCMSSGFILDRLNKALDMAMFVSRKTDEEEGRRKERKKNCVFSSFSKALSVWLLVPKNSDFRFLSDRQCPLPFCLCSCQTDSADTELCDFGFLRECAVHMLCRINGPSGFLLLGEFSEKPARPYKSTTIGNQQATDGEQQRKNNERSKTSKGEHSGAIRHRSLRNSLARSVDLEQPVKTTWTERQKTNTQTHAQKTHERTTRESTRRERESERERARV